MGVCFDLLVWHSVGCNVSNKSTIDEVHCTQKAQDHYHLLTFSSELEPRTKRIPWKLEGAKDKKERRLRKKERKKTVKEDAEMS